jgi:hypothetical protein
MERIRVCRYPHPCAGIIRIRFQGSRLSASSQPMVYGSPSVLSDHSYHLSPSMSKEEIVRGCNPAGMMECWNIGKMGLQIQKYWATGPQKVEDHKV